MESLLYKHAQEFVGKPTGIFWNACMACSRGKCRYVPRLVVAGCWWLLIVAAALAAVSGPWKLLDLEVCAEWHKC